MVQGSNFIILLVDNIQFSKHLFMKRLFFPLEWSWRFFGNSPFLTISVRVYFWILFSFIDLCICHSASITLFWLLQLYFLILNFDSFYFFFFPNCYDQNFQHSSRSGKWHPFLVTDLRVWVSVSTLSKMLAVVFS